MKKSYFLSGVKSGMPIFFGYFAVSFSFGIEAVKIGIEPIFAIIMSATNLTSAGQFAALSVISSGLTYLEMALLQFVINLRYSLMSSALSQKFDSKTPLFHRFLIAFGNTDEVFGVLSSVKGKLKPSFCYGVISPAIPGWVAGTALGAFAGTVLPKSVLSALGIVLYGMFIAIIVPTARKDKFILALILTAFLLSTLFAVLPLLKTVSSGFKIIIITVLLSSIAAIIRPVKEESEGDKV